MTIHYYTRQGCHLCEIMLEQLLPIIRDRVKLDVRDIDSQPDWRRKYDIRVPVLEADGRVISEYPLDVAAISDYLASFDGSRPGVAE